MLDMSWGEVMLIGGVALIVIGPKDLPKALRTVGQITSKLRRMAGEFQMQFNEAIREAELDEVRKEVDGIRASARSASNFNPVQTIRDELKGAVEGRAARADAAQPAEAAPPAPAAPEEAASGTYGPVRPAASEPAPSTTLADATARLKAEQGAVHAQEAAHTREAASTHDAAPAREDAHPPPHPVPELPLPVPGSVDDPFGSPAPAQNGAAGR